MGQLIIFEGLDGSGKGTQTKLTAQRLKEQGRDLRQITFPDYDSESSALVKMYRTPVLEAAADALGRFSELAVRL